MGAALFEGFGVGASLLVAIGAQNSFLIRRGLARDHIVVVALVCSLCDLTLIAVGVAGTGTAVASSPFLADLARWGGAAYLVVFGLRSFAKAVRPEALGPGPASGGSPLARTIWATLAVSLLNPHVYLDTVVVLGGIGGHFKMPQRAGFAAGAMLASTLWFFGVGLGASALAPLFADRRTWRALDVAVGLTVCAVAVSLLLGGR
jgi:L-lysine exporter family protein LysE/ArgO